MNKINAYAGTICILALKLHRSVSWPFLPFDSVKNQTDKYTILVKYETKILQKQKRRNYGRKNI